MEPLLASTYTLPIRGTHVCDSLLQVSMWGPEPVLFSARIPKWLNLALSTDKQVTWGTSMPGWELQSFCFSSRAAATTRSQCVTELSLAEVSVFSVFCWWWWFWTGVSILITWPISLQNCGVFLFKNLFLVLNQLLNALHFWIKFKKKKKRLSLGENVQEQQNY